jgi:hypothetical protein
MSSGISVKSAMNELVSLKKEIDVRKKSLNKMTTRVKELNEVINKFLDQEKQSGIKDVNNGIAIIKEKQIKNVRKKKVDIMNDSLNVLHNYMDSDKARKIYNEMQNASKDKTEKNVLKIIKL